MSSVQPCVRSELDDYQHLERDASAEKLSRPQKRRRRLQQLAVYKATATKSGGPKENEVLAKLEEIGHNLQTLVTCVSSAGCWPQKDAFNYTGTWNPFDSGICSSNDCQDALLSYLNPDASEFLPESSCKAEQSDEVPAAENTNVKLDATGSAPSTLQGEQLEGVSKQNGRCEKCGSGGDGCFCWQLLCASCFKSADECICETPKLKRFTCHMCGVLKHFPLRKVGSETVDEL